MTPHILIAAKVVKHRKKMFKTLITPLPATGNHCNRVHSPLAHQTNTRFKIKILLSAHINVVDFNRKIINIRSISNEF